MYSLYIFLIQPDSGLFNVWFPSIFFRSFLDVLIFFPSNLKCDYAVCTAARPLVNSNSYQNYNFSILHKHFKQKYESDSKLVIFRWLKYDKDINSPLPLLPHSPCVPM